MDGTDGSAKPSPDLPEGRQKHFGTSVEAVEAVEGNQPDMRGAPFCARFGALPGDHP